MTTRFRTRAPSSRVRAYGALLTAAAVLVGWCGMSSATAKGGSTSRPAPVHLVTTTPSPRGDLSSATWDLPYGQPTSLDYVKAGTFSPDILVENMCTDLVRLTPTWQYKPSLAKSWKYTNSTTLVFTIRQGVHFWNGHELTSADVAYSMLRNMTAKDAPVNGVFYKFVKSIAVTGPFQVTVHFTKPDELFIKEMATVAGAIAEKSYIEAKGSSYGTATGGVMCTGPYELTTWSSGNDIVLKANPSFWTPGYRPKIKTITVKFITTTSTLASELLTGEITGTYEVPAPAYPELESATSGKLYFGKSLKVLGFGPMTPNGPQTNPKIRQALSLAINRPALASVLYEGAAVPEKTLTPVTAWTPAEESVYEAAYAKLPSLAPDLAEARKLVKSVPGHTRTMTMALLAGTQTMAEAATEVQQAATSIGLSVKLDELQTTSFLDALYEPQYRKGLDFFFSTGYLDVTDPLDYLSEFIGKTADFNWAHYVNATVTQDVTKAFSTFTDAARAHLITEAQAVYTSDEFYIPLLGPDEALFMNKKITGAPASFAYIYEPCLAKLGAAK